MALVNILDLETTGKLSPEARIIELSCRLCDYDTGEELKSLLLRFNPERNIEAQAVKIHKITNEDVKKELTFDKHLPTIESILEETDYLVAHNLIGFDYPMLKQEFERLGKILPEMKLFDTMLNGTCCTDLGKAPTLGELCFSMGVEYRPELAHSGSYDTQTLRDAFFAGVRYQWFNLK